MLSGVVLHPLKICKANENRGTKAEVDRKPSTSKMLGMFMVSVQIPNSEGCMQQKSLSSSVAVLKLHTPFTVGIREEPGEKKTNLPNLDSSLNWGSLDPLLCCPLIKAINSVICSAVAGGGARAAVSKVAGW